MILSPFWLPFGSILASFCLYFESLLAPWGGPWRVFVFRSFSWPPWGPFRLPFGLILTPILLPFSTEKVSVFSIDFQRHFVTILAPLLAQFSSKIDSDVKKAILWKWASRVHEVLIFKDLGPQNPSNNRWKINRSTDKYWSIITSKWN